MKPTIRTAARSRAMTALALIVVIAAGSLSRPVGPGLCGLVAKIAGDVLWGAMFYLLVALAWPRVPSLAAAVIAFAVASATELLKLFHAPWIEALRAQPVLGTLLGHVFARSDFVAYAIGAVIAAAADLIIRWRPDEWRGSLGGPPR